MLFNVEPVTIKDIDALLEIDKQLFHPHNWSNDFMRYQLEAPEAKYCKTVVGDSIVGYIGGFNSFGVVDLMTVGVLPKFQGQGIGKALLQHLLNYYRETGAEKVLLEVETGNTIAIELYKKLGFQQVKVIDKYYGDKQAYLMELFFK
jgi:ribosomal-protein-alanine N-acetyltransferase